MFRFASCGWIGVEIFFVICGFVICMSCRGRTPRQFFVSRVIRLYPAYWFAVLFTTAALIAVPGVWERLRLREVLLNLTTLQSGSGVPDVDGVYWTLWSEPRFHLLFMVAVALGYTDRIRWKWLVTAGAMTYPLYLVHYAAGTALIARLRDTMDARLLIAVLVTGFLLLSYLIHRFVERPLSRLLKRGLDTSFARLRNADHRP
ncbi:acyltransferase family protein [Streptomyces sp. E5N91]|uniref:acyltransferase family protein n=1 Tax=Streptomyces sp. E5N91 TaxID=1851996 RepID=UPI001EE94F78|nr:acyltransferase family protein [Streptomyces sp. E5N91]